MKNGKTLIYKPHRGEKSGETKEVGKTMIIYQPTPANAGHMDHHAATPADLQNQGPSLWALIEIEKILSQ